MIIVKIKGGLGNQMFQYAFARASAERLATNLKIDASYYEKQEILSLRKDTPREFLLDKFNADITLCTERESSVANPAWFQMYKKISRKLFGYPQTYVYDVGQFPRSKNAFIDGDWQSEKYFSSISERIRADFKLKDELGISAKDLLSQIKTTDSSGKISVSIHVRRTDIVNPKSNYYGICTIEYYKKAFEKISSILPNRQLEVFVFSDDIEWVKNNLVLPCPMHFVSRPEIKDYEELTLMSACAHNIIANSSFSWWGAWLNTNQFKIIIAPSRWMNITTPTPDIMPDTWIKI